MCFQPLVTNMSCQSSVIERMNPNGTNGYDTVRAAERPCSAGAANQSELQKEKEKQIEKEKKEKKEKKDSLEQVKSSVQASPAHISYDRQNLETDFTLDSSKNTVTYCMRS